MMRGKILQHAKLTDNQFQAALVGAEEPQTPLTIKQPPAFIAGKKSQASKAGNKRRASAKPNYYSAG